MGGMGRWARGVEGGGGVWNCGSGGHRGDAGATTCRGVSGDEGGESVNKVGGGQGLEGVRKVWTGGWGGGRGDVSGVTLLCGGAAGAGEGRNG